MQITARQTAAARTALGLTREDLAVAADVGSRTISDFERGVREPINATRKALREALEARGAEFLPDGGVRLSGEALAAIEARKGEGLAE